METETWSSAGWKLEKWRFKKLKASGKVILISDQSSILAALGMYVWCDHSILIIFDDL